MCILGLANLQTLLFKGVGIEAENGFLGQIGNELLSTPTNFLLIMEEKKRLEVPILHPKLIYSLFLKTLSFSQGIIGAILRHRIQK